MDRTFVVVSLIFLMCITSIPATAQDGGYNVTSGLWIKAVLQVSGNPVTLVWEEVGSETLENGDTIFGGYFYADPCDFFYGSQSNPEIFIKIYVANNGWANIVFNHVTVDPVAVYSAHNYSESPNQSGTITLSNRLAEHRYTGVATTKVTGLWAVYETRNGDPPDQEPSLCEFNQRGNTVTFRYDFNPTPHYGTISGSKITFGFMAWRYIYYYKGVFCENSMSGTYIMRDISQPLPGEVWDPIGTWRAERR